MPGKSTSPARRVHAFIDGQNLYHAAKDCFGYRYPNYDPIQLARETTALSPGRRLEKVHFYTGMHNSRRNPMWHEFWKAKLRGLRNAGARVISRPLKYDAIGKGREKGIDVRLALDLVRLARRRDYEVAIIFSQDTDLAEAVNEVHAICREMTSSIDLECAFPYPGQNRRGLGGTTWIRIDRALYDRCIDPRNYFPRRPSRPRS